MEKDLNKDPIQINILVVDDEEAIRKLVKRSLASQGYEIHLATDGEQAFEMLTRTLYDLVITDVLMPHMDGIELTKRIIEYFPADVIVMTGQIDQYSYDQFIGLGASEFVQKPFPPDEMILRVKRVLRERELKEELFRSNRELAHSQKLDSIGQLAAGIAHEINTPLQYIADNTLFIKETFLNMKETVVQLLAVYAAVKKGSVSPEIIDQASLKVNLSDLEYAQNELPITIDETLEGVSRIKEVINAMKVFSHPGKKEHVPANLNDCIKNAVTITKNEWKYVADLSLALDPDLPLIRCNPGELNQVFLNLIVNASHAISEKRGTDLKMGKIVIQTRKSNNCAEIEISDTGSGIPQDIIPRVFDPFFTTKDIGKGTGQGLAIARSIVVDRHQGKIDFKTKKNHGTTFCIQLPISSS